METTTTINRLKFETFKKKRNKSFEPLPKWFNETVYGIMLSFINEGKRLQAVKYIYDIAKEKRTDMPLKTAKVEYLDEIELIGGKVSPVQSAPNPDAMKTVGSFSTSTNSINKQEVLRVLEPFARMANQCLHNSGLHKDQVVYAYNNAQITMQDLRNVEALINRLTR